MIEETITWRRDGVVEVDPPDPRTITGLYEYAAIGQRVRASVRALYDLLNNADREQRAKHRDAIVSLLADNIDDAVGQCEPDGCGFICEAKIEEDGKVELFLDVFPRGWIDHCHVIIRSKV